MRRRHWIQVREPPTPSPVHFPIRPRVNYCGSLSPRLRQAIIIHRSGRRRGDGPAQVDRPAADVTAYPSPFRRRSTVTFVASLGRLGRGANLRLSNDVMLAHSQWLARYTASANCIPAEAWELACATALIQPCRHSPFDSTRTISTRSSARMSRLTNLRSQCSRSKIETRDPGATLIASSGASYQGDRT